ncbi:MAG: hypothetical protein AMJ65_17025 [Phycisphaerae bacterium SG8_4]|nr:MAG: hypothetical protein AMJ65_17025 [Phycisphaerae bacterium SG8_4]
MAETPTTLRSGKSLPEIIEASELSDEAQALFADDQTPKEYVELLIEREHYPDAVRFLAHALPKREAVWWAWVSAKRIAGEDPPLETRAVLEATEAWIKEPTDQNRRVAMAKAEAADLSTSAGCAGLAAFFSGGSLAPPDVDAVPPGEYMAAKAIAGSIVLAAVSVEPEKANEKFQGFIEQGMVVADKIQLWTPPEAGL